MKLEKVKHQDGRYQSFSKAQDQSVRYPQWQLELTGAKEMYTTENKQ